MKKVIFLFFLQSICVLSAQASYTFIPAFNPQKPYLINIHVKGNMQDARGKRYHEFDDTKKVELRYKQTIGNQNYFSWRIVEIIHNHSKNTCNCNEGIDLVSNLDFMIKTDSAGKYLGIENIENAKYQITSRITKEAIKQAKKKSKDRYSTAVYYDRMKNDPSNILREQEYEIRKYFLYYGIQFKPEEKDAQVKRYDFLLTT